MKSNRFLPVFSSLLFSLVSLSFASAQTNVSMKVDLVSWGSDLSGLSLKGGAKNETHTALGFRYSKPIQYTGPAIMEISRISSADTPTTPEKDQILDEVQKLGPAPAEPVKPTQVSGDIPAAILEGRKTNPSLAALVALPTTSRRVTILLAPGPDNTLKSWVIDDDPSKLPLGILRVHNFSPNVIGIRCNGKEPKVLKPREVTDAEPVQREVTYELSYQQEGEWKMQENNLMRVTENEQVQLIILQSDDKFFRSNDGSRGGFLQMVTLRRSKES